MDRRLPPTVQELSDRSSAIIEDAAERSRVSLRERVERLGLAWRSVVQITLAATAAWFLASEVVGHVRPIFAPISAVIVLGLTVGQRSRRAVELALGVAVGIAIADLLSIAVGTGTWQLALFVGLALSIAILLGSGPLFATQAAVSAILVASLENNTGSVSVGRFTDALVGAACGLLVGAFILPVDPLKLVRRAAEPVLGELAGTLDDIADAIAAADIDAAQYALLRARGIDAWGARFTEAVDEGRETARFAPPRRWAREPVSLYAEAEGQIDLAVRNVRVLGRAAWRGIRLGENLPPEISDSLHDLAEAVRRLDTALREPERREEARAPALRSAATATRVLERTGNLSVSMVVGQVRSTAVDLLRGTGLSYEEAVEAVREAVSAAEQDELETP